MKAKFPLVQATSSNIRYALLKNNVPVLKFKELFCVFVPRDQFLVKNW